MVIGMVPLRIAVPALTKSDSTEPDIQMMEYRHLAAKLLL